MVDKVLDILRHTITWYHIALHFVTLFILDDCMFRLVFGKYLILISFIDET